MKILVTESQYRFILNEASKKDILINKLGLSEENAEILDRLCGPLSVWIGNKFIEYIYLKKYQYSPHDRNTGNERTKKVVDYLNRSRLLNGHRHRAEITGIMDYIRVGRGGNINSIKDLDFTNLLRLSNEWHNSLDIGEGDFNYIEKNDIIRDYRKDGLGYYWADLNTSDSREECHRMGHCGRTNLENTIYSLREVKKIGEGYTINKSHLTAAVGDVDGKIYQLKGSKNSKPQEKYFPYIVDLLINTPHIRGFGSEYNSANDFKISDLNESDVRNLYKLRPDLFTGRREKTLLQSLGLLEKTSDIFQFKIDPDDVHRYVDGDWVVRRVKSKDGRTTTYGLFESLLSRDLYGLYDTRYDGDWKDALNYYVNKESIARIKDIVTKKAQNLNIDITDYNLKEAIDEVDEDDEIKEMLSYTVETASSDAEYDYFYKKLKSCLSDYGNVLDMDDTGVLIEVNFDSFVKKFQVNDEDLDSSYESCNDDIKCVFEEIVIGNYAVDKPEFSIDSRWSPEIDRENFNEILSERLNEIE